MCVAENLFYIFVLISTTLYKCAQLFKDVCLLTEKSLIFENHRYLKNDR